MYLEYAPPNQELKKDVENIESIQPSVNLHDTLAEQGKDLRILAIKWNGKLTRDFKEEVKKMIDLTNEPLVVGDMPNIPNPDAFDSSSKEQMDEFKEKVSGIFEAMKDWNKRKEAFQGKSTGETDVNHRYMKVSQGLKNLVNWLTPVQQKRLTMPSGDVLVCMDEGTFPGHMVALVGKHRKDGEKAKYLASLNYMANQHGFALMGGKEPKKDILQDLGEIPMMPSDAKEVIDEGEKLNTELNMMTKRQLLEMAGDSADKSMNKSEIIEILLAKDETDESE